MNDNENRNGMVDGWWAASSEAEHEQTVTLRRRENGSEPLLDRFTVAPETMPTFEDFEFSVKERFGGGLYVAVITGKSGQFGKRIPFAIAGLPKREAGQEEKNSSGGLEGLAAILMKNQEASEARMMAVLDKMTEKQEAPDAFELFDKVAGLLGKTGAAPAPQKSLVEQMRELREGAEMMGLTGKPEGDEGGNWANNLIATFGPALMGGLSAPAEPGDEGDDPAPAEVAQAQALGKLKLLLTSMVQLAEFEVVPAKAVAGIEKKAGQYWPMLQQIIQRPDAVALAEQMVPAVASHRAWFEAFRAAVIGGPVSEGGEGGSTGKKPAGSKKPAASNKPRAVGQRSHRNTADA